MIFVSTIVTPTYRRFAPFQPSKELASGPTSGPHRLVRGSPVSRQVKRHRRSCENFSSSLFSILAECMIPE